MKKIFGVLTSMAMALALLVMPVRAEGSIVLVDGTEYDNLVPALNYINNKQGNDVIEVTLLQDISGVSTITIPEGKKIVLDLNGKKIETSTKPNDSTRHYYAIDNYGELTINDSSNGTGSIIARGIENLDNGKMTINGGTFYSIDNNGGASVWNEADLLINGGKFKTIYVGSSSDSVGVGCLNNQGTAIITGGIFDDVNKRTYAIISTGDILISPENGKEVIVNGAHGGLAIDSGTAIVNGGEYSSTDYYGLYVSNDGVGLDPMTAAVTVNGGTYNGKIYSVWIGSDYNDPVNSTIEINGGEFKKPLNAQECTREGAIVIKGGTHLSDPSDYVANGYKSYKLSDTEYKVAPVVTGIKLDKNVLTLNLKDMTTATLTATLTPETTLDTVDWTTSDPKVVTVENGKVTAVAEGTATIKATVNGKEATCTVTVLGNRTVTFDNEGTKTTATVVKGEKVAEPTKPTKEGYTFAGWYNGTEKYDFTKPVTDNLTLTAKWTINTYTVTFSDGVTAQKVEHGKLVAEPTTPTKDGYTFVGWYNGKEKYDFTKPVTKDLTLTAEWKVVPGKEEVEVPTIDPKEPVEEVTIGVANQGKTETILTESIKDETLKEAIEEKIADGIDVNTVVNVDLVKPEETSEEVKKDIEKVIAAAKENNVEVAQYLDINIKVMAGDEELGKITTTTEKLTFQVAVPEELKKEGRTFIVIRVHDGKVEELKTVEKDGMLTFETDKFSTYALTYKDVEPTKPSTPDTSDMSMIINFGIMAILSGMILVVLKKKESLR